jgi:hypothetical protein
MEYLSFVINSLEMTLALPEQKLQKLIQSCQQLLLNRVSSVRELAKVVGKLTSSIQAILPAPLHYRHLQMLQIKTLIAGKSYETQVTLDQSCWDDLQWWIDHITSWNGRAIAMSAPDLVITTDASLKGWGAICQGIHTRGLWTQQEAFLHINALELNAALFAVRAFTANRTDIHVHLRMDNRTAITYILKMGGTRSPVLLQIAQELWKYSLGNKIMLTAEYLPGVLNQQADWESRHFLDSSNWKLNPGVFKILNQQWGPLEVDLFASRTKGQNYKRITDNPLFCVISTINCYHDRNKGWHNGSGKSQLLLSFVEPHKPVVPCTIAGWLVQVMSSAGVDTPKFRAHSTRGTATSKGQAKGLSRQEIINMARWKKASTLKRHYLRDIVTDTEKSCTH